jgi:hypothetical protein
MNESKNSRKKPDGYYFYTNPQDARRITVCGIKNPENPNQLLIGTTVCSPKDNFTRRRGRVIAQGRALSNPVHVLEITNEEPLGRFFFKTAQSLAGVILSNFNEKRGIHRDSITK